MLRLIKNSPKAQYRTLNPRRNLMMPTNVAQQKKPRRSKLYFLSKSPLSFITVVWDRRAKNISRRKMLSPARAR